MTAALVLDASALVALLADGGDMGEWVASEVAAKRLAAPELVLYEVANVLRRQARHGVLEAAEATSAHADLLALPIELWPYEPLAERAWALRDNVTVYDAVYVALAELLTAPLLTLDERLSRATGPRCRVLTPPHRTSAPGGTC
ncbi:MAG: type II toxin-antitoxin system VapC family toxin [Actinomycetota bacterium]|nr:type II toxin-antitoxin system VapC family toxin [Actinomycetota bacterium]